MDASNQVPQQPLRILHVVTNMSYGGLENLLMSYYRKIDRQKVQFDFLTHFADHQDFEEEIAALGGRLFRLPRLNPVSRSYHQSLLQFFREHPEYRIVHSHLDCMAGIPLKAAEECGVPVRIAHSHNSNQTKNLKYPIKMFYRKHIKQYATDLFACSKTAGDWMFRGSSFTVMRNAIDASAFQYNPSLREAVRHTLNLDNDFVIGHVGQFREQKNHLFLIEIFSEFLKLHPTGKLLLAGKGPTFKASQELASKLHISDHILFLGARSDISDLMQAMDIFILPSLYEGLPVTMVEAQASGLPCLISDHVPADCIITDHVKQLPLSAGAAFWAKELETQTGYIRKDTYHEIVNAGFDIQNNAAWLEDFYCHAEK